LNVAFGAEYRNENFQIKQGQPESYNTYDGGVVTGTTQTILKFLPFIILDLMVGNWPGASQVFPGFKPVMLLIKEE
jgi:iron complex outermembrane receptor protein